MARARKLYRKGDAVINGLMIGIVDSMVKPAENHNKAIYKVIDCHIIEKGYDWPSEGNCTMQPDRRCRLIEYYRYLDEKRWTESGLNTLTTDPK